MSPYFRKPEVSRKRRKLICWLLTIFVVLLVGCCECVFIASKHSLFMAVAVKAGLRHGRAVRERLARTTFDTWISVVIAVLLGNFDFCNLASVPGVQVVVWHRWGKGRLLFLCLWCMWGVQNLGVWCQEIDRFENRGRVFRPVLRGWYLCKLGCRGRFCRRGTGRGLWVRWFLYSCLTVARSRCYSDNIR